MVFLEDFKSIDKNYVIGITGLLSNITTREGSHKGGWTRLLRCQLINMGWNPENVVILDNKMSLDWFDAIIFDLGAEYSGTLNMFGGLDDKVFKRLNEIKSYEGPIFSWRNDLPSLSILSGRRNNESTCEAFKQAGPTFLEEVQKVLDNCQVFQHAYKTDKLLIGDSHTPSVWTPEYMIERRDGRTLKGMVEHETVYRYVTTMPYVKHFHVHCGSIDIRHHLMREIDPPEACAKFVLLMTEQLALITQVESATLTHTMGIEDVSRELPKTGYFRGEPFAGTWEQRNELREIFNACLELSVDRRDEWNLIKFPDYFFDQHGKLKFEVMEKPGSVHLSPEHYRWNLDTNTNRWIHEEGR